MDTMTTSPVSRSLCHSPRVEKMLRRFVSEAAAAVRAGEATFWTISANGRHMEGAINSGAKAQIIENASVPANDSVVGLAATTGVAVSIGPDDYQNPSIAKLTGLAVVAMTVAPVRAGGHICGALSAVNPVGGGLFTQSDLETLQWKAYLLGLLLDDVTKDAGAG